MYTLRHTMLLLVMLALGACVYRPDIKQGNFLKSSMIAQVKPGMTEAQVTYVLGTPMVQDPFHPDRWDYVYYNVPSTLSSDTRTRERHVVVLFKNGKVVSVEQRPIAKHAGG